MDTKTVINNLIGDVPQETCTSRMLSTVVEYCYNLGKDLLLLDIEPGMTIMGIGTGGFLGILPLYPGINKVLGGIYLPVTESQIKLTFELPDEALFSTVSKPMLQRMKQCAESIAGDTNYLVFTATTMNNKNEGKDFEAFISMKGRDYHMTFANEFYLWDPSKYEEIRAVQNEAYFVVLLNLLMGKEPDQFRAVITSRSRADIVTI